MKLWNVFLTDLKKILLQAAFPLSALLFGALCFTSVVSHVNGANLTVLELALYYTPGQIMDKLYMSARDLFLGGMGTYNIMFAPMVAALPAIPLYCRERAGGALRFVMPRCGVRNRSLSMVCATMLSGGLVVLLGYALYGLCCAVIFPPPSEQLLAMYAGDDYVSTLYMIKRLIGVFLFGCTSTLPAVLLSSVTKNAYVVLCGAFSVLYGFNSLWSQVATSAASAENWPLYSLATILNPVEIRWLFTQEPLERACIILLWLVITLLTLFAVLLSFKKRFDRGT